MARTAPPDPFRSDDRAIYDVYVANRAAASLAVALRLGLFRSLADRAKTLEEIRAELGFERRPVDALLTALVAIGLLRRTGDGVDGPLAEGPDGPRYEPTPLAIDHLLPESPFYLGGLIDLENELFVSPANLLEAMRLNRPQAYGNKDPWDAMAADLQAAASFTRAMHSISVRPAFGLAAVFDFAGVKNLLDVGGGSGILSIAAALKNPALRATVQDLPGPLMVAREMVAAYAVDDRVRVHAADMFHDPFPAGHDAILFSQIFHDWTPKEARLLLAKAHEALPPGGRVLIHEKLLDDARDGPVANALISVDMLYWTDGQQYSAAELHALLGEAGFVHPETRATVGYWSVTWGEKAGRATA